MAKNEALSEFLTGRRAAVSPAQAGLNVTGPRRVPGLRREEVAILAGVSVDWYVRLEQGRQVTPSESVLNAIGTILRLDDAERDYLVNLARPAAGIGGRRPASPVRPGIVRMLRSFDRQAAFVVGPRSEVLAGNDLAWALLTDFPRRAPGDRNLLRWMLLDEEARSLYKEWDQVVSDQVGVLQLEASARPNDPEMQSFVGELATKSPQFRAWWSIPNPQGRTAGRKTFVHPAVGELVIDWEAFIIPGNEGQTLFVNTPADAAAEESLRLLASWWATERGGDQQADRTANHRSTTPPHTSSPGR
ncbi:helix-turn-helix domain-containing protein [Microbacteriaceae bacterium VKM Ac-2854]|nr:helix-turn-helix domain-containing protein [Microbacteriaceae bacterium VKM Ac-2854]